MVDMSWSAEPALSADEVEVLFPGGELPTREAWWRRRLVQLVAVIALAVSVSYLWWRVTSTFADTLWISIPVWMLEVHAVVSLALFTFSLWDVDSEEPPAPVT